MSGRNGHAAIAAAPRFRIGGGRGAIDVPKSLGPYEDHGVVFTDTAGDELIGIDPRCGKTKLYVNRKTGQWTCHGGDCGDGGNVYTWMRIMADLYAETTTREDYGALADELGLPPSAVEVFREAGIGIMYGGDLWSIPIRNEKGTTVDIRRHGNHGGGKRHRRSTRGVSEWSGVGLFGAELLAAGGDETVYVCESETDAIALRSLLRAAKAAGVVVAVPGARVFKEKWVSWFAGRRVVLAYDRDKAGRDGKRKAAGLLAGVAASILTIAWPAGVNDARDFITRRAGKPALAYRALRKLRRRMRVTTPAATASTDGAIELGPDEHRVVDEVIVKLADVDGGLYVRGDVLVHTVRAADSTRDGIARPDAAPVIRPVTKTHARTRISRCKFVQKTQQGLSRAHVPKYLPGQVVEHGEWPGIPRLNGTSRVPVLRPDGSVWMTPGYDSATGVLFTPAGDCYPIPTTITSRILRDAIKTLSEMTCDFPYENDAHRAASVASLLTPIGRHAYEGCTPLFLFDGNQPAVGKGMLAGVNGRVALGHDLPTSTYAEDDAELRKRITATLIAGDPIHLFDNIEGRFGSPALNAALTAGVWTDRLLGGNRTLTLPIKTVFYATGNNIQPVRDMLRRIVYVRLKYLGDDPEQRRFKHPNLMRWVRRNHGALAAAGLTILAGYLRAGRPSQGLRPFGSFEGWSDTIRSAIVWAGLPDPCATRAEIPNADDTSDLLGKVLQAWHAHYGSAIVIASDINNGILRTMPKDKSAGALKSALMELLGGDDVSGKSLGRALARCRDQKAGDLYLSSTAKTKRGCGWRVQKVGSG